MVFETSRGDDYQFEVEITDNTGAAVDLDTLERLTVSFRKPPADTVLVVKTTDTPSQISKGVDPSLGIATVFLTGAETVLMLGAYEFDVQVTYADHTKYTPSKYTLMVKGDVSAP
jgi:hypothetical protein